MAELQSANWKFTSGALSSMPEQNITQEERLARHEERLKIQRRWLFLILLGLIATALFAVIAAIILQQQQDELRIEQRELKILIQSLREK